jgi:hypothetical protein
MGDTRALKDHRRPDRGVLAFPLDPVWFDEAWTVANEQR